jgi:hypothetical protein
MNNAVDQLPTGLARVGTISGLIRKSETRRISTIVREITVNQGRDLAYEAWCRWEPEAVPPPSFLTRCRSIIDQRRLVSLINRLGFQGSLSTYAVEEASFLDLLSGEASQGSAA